MRRGFTAMAVFVIFLIAFADATTYLRYNLLGYYPQMTKRAVIMSDSDIAGTKWEIQSKDGTSAVSGTLGKSLYGKSDYTSMPYNYEIDFTKVNTVGEYNLIIGKESASVKIADKLVGDVISENLRWLKVHRSGCKDVLDRKPAHFGDSASIVYRRSGPNPTDEWVEDKNLKKVNLLGGWYDGYVYTKFTLLIAHLTHDLLLAYEINPNVFTRKFSKTDLVDVLDEAKWGLDYLMKVMPDDEDFIIQCGGFMDNENGTRLPSEDNLDGKRECYSAISPTQMGSAAAALALGSTVFAKLGKKDIAEKYKDMAEKIFKKATSKPYSPVWLEKDYDLYKDNTANDNMALAAAELLNATKDQYYKTKLTKYAQLAKSAGWVSYGDQNIVSNYRAMKAYPPAKKYLAEDISDFMSATTKYGNIWRVPMEFTFGSNYAFMQIATYADLYNSEKYGKNADDVFDYIFGLNAWGKSFVATDKIKKAATRFFSQIYMLQTHLYPHGGISVGALDAETHDEESRWCGFDVRVQEEYKFNTKKMKFFDHSDDYMCMGANTYGVADGILFFSVMAAKYEK